MTDANRAVETERNLGIEWRRQMEQAKARCFDLSQELATPKAKTTTALGVGDGSGQLFVYGTHEAIKAAQAYVIASDEQAGELWRAIRTATGIARAVASRRYAADKFEPLNTLDGVLSQIDNMTAGLLEDWESRPKSLEVAVKLHTSSILPQLERFKAVLEAATVVRHYHSQHCDEMLKTKAIPSLIAALDALEAGQ